MRFVACVAVLVCLGLSPSAAWSSNHVLYYYEFDEGEGDWEHVDLTAGAVPRFHLDAYLAFDDPEFENDVSWWCGTFDYDADGGYGNSWDQRLVLPPVPLVMTSVSETSWGSIKSTFLPASSRDDSLTKERSPWPVLTFAFRHETEPGYDFVWVDALDDGAWRHLDEGYDGSSGGWLDLGASGYDLRGLGDPVRLRFRFISDGAWSDEDGIFETDGGAFHVDNIRIYDYVTGEVYFSEDCQADVECTPSVPEPAGDWWHIVERRCPEMGSLDRHAWWCGDDADTTHIPPGLRNALISPPMDNYSSNCVWCTLRLGLHPRVPGGDPGDRFTYEISPDDGETWYQIGNWFGDLAECASWAWNSLYGYDVSEYLGHPYNGTLRFRLTMYTNDDGCGPGVSGGAGVFVDCLWLEGSMCNWPAGPSDDGRWVRRLRERLLSRGRMLRPAGRGGGP
jgi:hypothetical protein